MVIELVKRKLLDLYQYNIYPRVDALHAEQIYQGIFDQQCRNLGIPNIYYPVGAAASYSFLYLLTRIVTESPVRTIVELGSGQTTLLIDRIRNAEGRHVTYENDIGWVNTLAPRLERCDYRHRDLTPQIFENVAFHGYAGLEETSFDLLVVDGPNGTDHHSRFSCVPLIAANRSPEFVIVLDDASRSGEIETVELIKKMLEERGVDFKLNHLAGRTTQAVFTTPKFRSASYFF